jgi:hypothetical protein
MAPPSASGPSTHAASRRTTTWNRDANGVWVVIIEVRDACQLFNSLDPSPFRERDLDRDAAAFIEGEVKDLPRRDPVRLVIRGPRDADDRLAHAPQAVSNYFALHARTTRELLRNTLREGRFSLVIGLAFVAVVILVSRLVLSVIPTGTIASTIVDSLTIVSWVAMWHPVELLLYDWWPIRATARHYQRLADMPVSVEYRSASH